MPLPGVVDSFGVPTVDPWDELGQLLATPPPVPAPDQATPAPAPGPTSPVWPPADIAAQIAPPPPPMPDAVSGAAPLPIIPDAVTGAAPLPEPDVPAPTRSWFHPDSFEKSDDELAWDFSSDPRAIANYSADVEAGRQQVGAQGKAAALARDARAAVENQRILREAQAKSQQTIAEIDVDAKKLADEKVGWASKSAPQKLAGVLAAIVGGLVQSRTGAQRNAGFDMVNQIIEGEIAEHRAKMGELRGRRGDAVSDLQRNFDQFRAEETLRQSMLEQAARQVESDMANYDPKGTLFAKKAALAGQIRSAYAASQQKFAEEDFKRRLELSKHALAVETQQQTARHQRAEEGIGYANAATARQRLALDREQGGLDRSLKREELDLKRQELGQKQADALEKADREMGIGGEVHTTMVKQQVPDPVTGALVEREVPIVKVDQLRQKDGSVFHAPEHAQQPLIKQRTGTQDLINALADLKELRKSAGGADKYTSPGDQAKFDQLTNRAVIAYATSKGLSLADKQSTDFARDAILGGDPSAYRAGDVEQRIESAIADGTRSYHNALKGNGYNGPLPSFERPAREADLSTAEGASAKVQQGKSSLEAADDATPGVLSKINPLGQQSVLNPFSKSDEEIQQRAFDATDSLLIPGLSDEQARGVKSLLEQAHDPQADQRSKDAARQELVNLATTPGRGVLQSPILKELAAEAPDLFEAALTKLPKNEQQFWSQWRRK